MSRFERQVCFEGIGIGQEKLLESSIAIIGCGGVGCFTAELVSRAGAKSITLVDGETVEESNLHRQLYSEKDLNKPKASTLAKKILASGNTKTVDAKDVALAKDNVKSILSGHDLILDCTDSMDARFLINEFCMNSGIPWIYSGAIGSLATAMPIIPRKTACFECVFGKMKGKKNPGCTQVINSAAASAASMQATYALKILLEKKISGEISYFDIWKGTFERAKTKRRADCPACGRL